MERVYVANLPPDIRIKDIDDFFRPFGKLVFIDVNHRANPVYANVQFDNARNAFNAVKARHGYDYEGYTLQLRLVENEVRNRRDATPPPQPSMYNNNYDQNASNNGRVGNNYSSRGNFQTNSLISQWSNSNRSDMRQLSIDNRPSMSQQNMGYSSNNRFNMEQSSIMPYSSGRPSIEQQFSNAIRSNMQQQFSNNTQEAFFNSNRSNMDQQFSNLNRSNMSMQNNLGNRRDMVQLNEGSYSGRSNMQQQYGNANRSNIPQLQNMNVQNPNNSWNMGNNDMGWNTANLGNNNNNANNYNGGSNATYNPNNVSYDARPEERYTSGLSGAGRKWYERFIRKGYSPELARAKALEHRTVPYLRDDNKTKSIPNNPTNMALETIGNTIISLLSANPSDIQAGLANNIGPSSSGAPQAQANAVSRRQYLKSLDMLKVIGQRRDKTSKDRITIKYHTQIVKDYEKLNKVGSRGKDGISKTGTQGNIAAKKSTSKQSTSGITSRRTNSSRAEEHLRESMSKLKAKLIKSARELGFEGQKRKRLGGAYKKRTRMLMDHGFMEMEAKSLAWNPVDKLEELLVLKREYDSVVKKTGFMPSTRTNLFNSSTRSTDKNVVYKNDLQYLEEYSKHRLKSLNKKILFGLQECIKRIHDYEKSKKLPLTETKFTTLLLKITSREDFFKSLTKPSSRRKKGRSSAVKPGEKSVEKNTDKKIVDGKKSEGNNDVKNKSDNQDDKNATGDNEVNDNKDQEENQDNEDAENLNNESEINQDNEDGDNHDAGEEDQDNGGEEDQVHDDNAEDANEEYLEEDNVEEYENGEVEEGNGDNEEAEDDNEEK